MINLDNCLTLFKWDTSVPNEMYTGVNMHTLLRGIKNINCMKKRTGEEMDVSIHYWSPRILYQMSYTCFSEHCAYSE